jgi:hypothetical protein
MGEIVNGEIVLTDDEARRLSEIRVRERTRPTTAEDEELIFIAKSMR